MRILETARTRGPGRGLFRRAIAATSVTEVAAIRALKIAVTDTAS
jgi:hypothetical protein